MKKGSIILSVTIFVISAASFIHASLQPRPFQWYPTYLAYDRQPYGAYVFFDQLQQLFPGQKVKRLAEEDLTVYEIFDPLYNGEYYEMEDDSIVEAVDTVLYLKELDEQFNANEFNLIGINDRFYLNDWDARSFLMHLFQGNHALIAANQLEGNLPHYLGIETENTSDYISDSLQLSKDEYEKRIERIWTNRFSFYRPDSSISRYKPVSWYSRIRSIPDSASVILQNVLGDTVAVNVRVGAGSLTFVTVPILFSNYHLLKNGHQIVEQWLLQMPNRDTYWTNYFLTGRDDYPVDRSLMEFIHSNESLKWAFYLLILALAVYFGLEVKRKQRAVPIVASPQNESLKFVDSISNLYLLKKDHRRLIKRKMIFFLEKIRAVYHLDTNVINDDFLKRLSSKSRVPLKIVSRLFAYYDVLMEKSRITDDELIRFNRLLQNFK